MSLENHRKTSFSGGLVFTGPFLNRFFSEGLSKRPDSLRSWRYCVGARLKFWRRSRVPEKGSRDEAVEISRGFAARDGSAVKSHSTTTQ